MILLKKWIILSFVYTFFVLSSTAWSMISPIESLEPVEDRVNCLLQQKVNPHEICVVFDFHGVIVEQISHRPPLHLKKGVQNTLDSLKEKKIPILIATAWSDFNAVIHDGIIPLNLQSYFDVAEINVELREFILGSEEKDYVGYKNGRVLAIRNASTETTFFPDKAFALELAYPNNNIKNILFIDDNKENLKKFREDAYAIKHTEARDFSGINLYHMLK